MNRQLNQRRPADRLFRLFPDLAGRRADPLRADAGFFAFFAMVASIVRR